MAENIHDKGAEEENKQPAGSHDDDFGLPDLEFEELEELDLDDSENTNEVAADTNSSDLIAAPSEKPVTERFETSLDEGIDEPAALGIADESELDSTAADAGRDDVFADPPHTDLGSDSFEGSSIFTNNPVAAEEDAGDGFQSADEASLPPSYKPYTDDNSKGGMVKWVFIGVFATAGIGMAFWFWSSDKEGGSIADAGTKPETIIEKPAEQVETSEPAAPPEESTAETEPTAEEPEEKSAPEQKTPKPASAAPAGEIVELTGGTGRYHIIIGSFVDEDLAKDYAQELSADGKGVKMIPPFGKYRRYRLSIADFGSISDAVAGLPDYRSTYGDSVWALRY